MKPSFALDFRDGVIALLHRTARGWHEVGATPVDAPDLGEALGYLRATALGLSPRGLACKLVIPNEQILYTQVHAPGPDAARRNRQIKAALEGLTPYAVADLVYDWWGTGPDVHVAVVAKETLAEAEAFAAEHRFNPVSFVAAPDDGAYRGEPFFGPSALSATLLAEGEKVERDAEPISVVAREYPRGEAVVVPEVAAVVAAPVPAPEPEPVVEVAPPEVVKVAPVAEAAPASPVPEVVEVEAVPPVVEAVVVPDADPDADALPDFSTARAPASGVPDFDTQAMVVELADEAPMVVDVGEDSPELAEPVDTAETVEPPLAKAVGDGPDVGEVSSTFAAFASRRSVEAAPLNQSPGDAVPADFAAAAEARARKSPPVGPALPPRPSVPRPSLAKPAAKPAMPGASRDALPFPGKAAAAKLAAVKAKVGVAPTATPGVGRNVVPLAKPGATAPDAAAKAVPKGLTGLDGRPLPVGGKPRYLGLILTGILLVALALVAFWSSYYLSSNDTDTGAEPAANQVAGVEPEPVLPVEEALPTVEDEALADGQDLGAEAPAPETLTTEANPAAEALPAEVAEPEPEVVATEPEAVTPEPVAVAEPAPVTGAGTEAAVALAPGNDPQDEVFLAAAATPPQTSDPVVMPLFLAGSDPPPGLAPPPPPFGTVYSFDAELRIQPTPEGIITPEGVLLIAGKPDVVPPARPAALQVAPAAPVAEAVPVAEPVVPVEEVGADPALAGKKPQPRPEGLVAPDATAVQQGEVLAPTADPRFADARPQKRPDALTEVAVAAPENEAGAASLAANGVQASVSGQGLAVSRRPAARPSGMDQAVDAAVAAAVQAPEVEAQTETASLAPEEQAEPDVEAPAPNLPTNASVAKQATQKEVLNLHRVALIGIFGTSNGRYAMVRQAGGGIKKVVVGDTIDGGRVAAISATELQYQKGGRIVTLSLPSG